MNDLGETPAAHPTKADSTTHVDTVLEPPTVDKVTESPANEDVEPTHNIQTACPRLSQTIRP